MSEPATLTSRALDRLLKLIDGNGRGPDSIKLLGTEEKIWELNGVMKLDPLTEAHAVRYAGGARGSAKVLPNIGALHAEVERRKQAFREKPDWIPAAIKQLKEQPAEGWGLDDVRITLPSHTAVLAAGNVCPSCQGHMMLTCQPCGGQGTVVCNHCNGNRQEICYNCAGRGVSPANPNQSCNVCNGRRYIPCRFCHATGHMTCPACRGNRGTTCAACNGAGTVTEEITLTCGARTHFLITGSGELPSGLRRGLDRIGIANLVNGYADIETVTPPVEMDDEILHAVPGGMEPEDTKEKPPSPEIHYLAKLPYADMRISFMGKATLVSSFGKRGALMGVPAFLDTALEPWRKKLRHAAMGTGGNLNDATGARLIRDALALQLSGKDKINDLRRLYPLGLTATVAAEILANVRRALNRITKRERATVVVACILASAGLFGGLFFTPLHTTLSQTIPGLTVKTQAAMDAGILLGTVLMSWLIFSLSIGLTLRKRFPNGKVSRLQNTGVAGYVMMAAIVVMFATALFFAPVKPAWMELFLR